MRCPSCLTVASMRRSSGLKWRLPGTSEDKASFTIDESYICSGSKQAVSLHSCSWWASKTACASSVADA
jgi:hypothetical protein